MAKTASITNEDLLETMQALMQMTHEGFEGLNNRMDRLENRMDSIEGRMDRLETEVQSLWTRVNEMATDIAMLKAYAMKFDDHHVAYMNDINDILDRIKALEARRPNITERELRELKQLLQTVVDWAQQVAKATNIPLRLPK